MTKMDLDARVRAKRAERFGAAPTGKPPQPATAKGKPATEAREKSRRRFATYNTFTDSVARFVPPAPREVWRVLWRFADADTNQLEVRVADVAARLNFDDRTVERGLKWLMVSGLLKRIRRGTRQTGPSLYWLDPNPDRHIETLRTQHERRAATRRQPETRPGTPTTRLRNGRFSTRRG
jgi:hypothetical protein